MDKKTINEEQFRKLVIAEAKRFISEAAGEDLEIKSMAKKMFSVLKKYKLRPKYDTGTINFNTKQQSLGYGGVVQVKEDENGSILTVALYYLGLLGATGQHKVDDRNAVDDRNTGNAGNTAIHEVDGAGNLNPEETKEVEVLANKILSELKALVDTNIYETVVNNKNNYGYYSFQVRKKVSKNKQAPARPPAPAPRKQAPARPPAPAPRKQAPAIPPAQQVAEEDNKKSLKNEASITGGGTVKGREDFQSVDDNKKIAMNIVNAITPELKKYRFQTFTLLEKDGKKQQYIQTITDSPQKQLALITADFGVGWDGGSRAGGIMVYVNKNFAPYLKKAVQNSKHPFVKMGNEAFSYSESNDIITLTIYDDGEQAPAQAAPAQAAPAQAKQAPARPPAPAPRKQAPAIPPAQQVAEGRKITFDKVETLINEMEVMNKSISSLSIDVNSTKEAVEESEVKSAPKRDLDVNEHNKNKNIIHVNEGEKDKWNRMLNYNVPSDDER